MMALKTTDNGHYELDDPLRSESAGPLVYTESPDADREDLLLKKLGARGWGRIQHFKQFYSSGWGEREGRPLSPRALGGLLRFLDEMEFPSKTFPSVFLTDSGGLELVWEDAAGHSVQVEFNSSGAEFFLEAEDREGAASMSDLKNLARELTANGR